MAGGIIAAAIIGITGTAASAAAQIARSSIQDARGNLPVSVEILNGTEYVLVPRWSGFRKGAAMGGIEGEWIRTPRPIDPRDVGVISATQVTGASTDVVGCVVYQSDIFDFMVGLHVYDQFGIQRYIFAGIFPKGHLFLPDFDRWAADGNFATDLKLWINGYIWSGAFSGNTYSSKGTTKGMGLKVQGKFRRGEVQQNPDGTFKVNEKGEPVLYHTEVTGNGSRIEFSTQATGGAKDMSAVVFDQDILFSGDRTNQYQVYSTSTGV